LQRGLSRLPKPPVLSIVPKSHQFKACKVSDGYSWLAKNKEARRTKTLGKQLPPQKRKRAIAHLRKATRTALAKQAAKVRKRRRS
jgi:hypothetical protein